MEEELLGTEIIDKKDPIDCITAFSNHFITQKTQILETILQLSFEGKLDSELIRAHSWKLMLGSISNSLEDSVVETVLNRRRFKKMLKLTSNKKVFIGDPLGGSKAKNGVSANNESNISNGLANSNLSNAGWDSFHQDNDLKKIILLDINRTYQEKELFTNQKVKESICSVLYIWSKENPGVSYKQGMNEILAVIVLTLYQYYFPTNTPKAKAKINVKVNTSSIDQNSSNHSNILETEGSARTSPDKANKESKARRLKDLIKEHLSPASSKTSSKQPQDSPDIKDKDKTSLFKLSLSKLLNDQSMSEELYYFFHDEEELYADAFYLFDIVMNRGLKEFYDTTMIPSKPSSKDPKDYVSFKQKELFQLHWQKDTTNSQPEEGQLPLQRRCNEIISVKLKLLEFDLFEYFNFIDIDCTIFLQRWLKCLFNRELEWPKIGTIWDSIFANDLAENLEGVSEEKFNNFNMIDYICIAMIIAIKDELIDRDQNECFGKLFRYPEIENPVLIIRLAVQVKDNILRKNGKKRVPLSLKESPSRVKNLPENEANKSSFVLQTLENTTSLDQESENEDKNKDYFHLDNSQNVEAKPSIEQDTLPEIKPILTNIESEKSEKEEDIDTSKAILPMQDIDKSLVVDKIEKLFFKYKYTFLKEDAEELQVLISSLK